MGKNMIRKQLYILPKHADSLREQAKEYGVSEGQLVRDALELFLRNPDVGKEIDLESWKEELQYIHKCRYKDQKPTNVESGWKREDLYER